MAENTLEFLFQLRDKRSLFSLGALGVAALSGLPPMFFRRSAWTDFIFLLRGRRGGGDIVALVGLIVRAMLWIFFFRAIVILTRVDVVDRGRSKSVLPATQVLGFLEGQALAIQLRGLAGVGLKPTDDDVAVGGIDLEEISPSAGLLGGD